MDETVRIDADPSPPGFLRRVRQIVGVGFVSLITLTLVITLGCRGDRSTGPEGTGAVTLSVTPASVTLFPGDTIQLKATALDADGNTVSGYQISWSSGDTTVAAVDGDGTVTGQNTGSTEISTTAENSRDTLSERADVAVEDSTSTNTITAPAMPTEISVAENARTDSSVSYTAAWSSSDGAVSYDWNAGSNSGSWSETGTVSDTTAFFTAPRSASSDSSFACVVAKNDAGSSESRCTGFTVPSTSDTSTSSGQGGLQVSTSTTGDSVDSDGYSVSVDGGSGQMIGVNDSTIFADLDAADHSVELSGVDSNCSVSGNNPRTVTVTKNDTVSTTFEVSCDTTATSSGDIHPNEPSGMTLLTDRDFSAVDQGIWNDEDSEPDWSLVSDQSGAPHSAPTAGRIRFPAGFDDGSDPARSTTGGWSLGNVVYFHYWVKYSSNFQVHPAIAKFGFLTDSSEGGGGAPLFWGMTGAEFSDPLEFSFRVQHSDLPNATYEANVGSGDLFRGQWHEIEAVIRYNTGSNSDGEIHAWVDGVKSHEYTDVQFGASGDHNFDSWRWEPIWGGNSGETVAETMYIWVDHIYISVK